MWELNKINIIVNNKAMLKIYYNMYNRLKAVEYAQTWWNARNPNYYNFDSLGGDCTNFVCQCLVAGGIEMLINIYDGWFYKSLDYRSASFTGVNEFYNFAIANNNKSGVKAKVCNISNVEIGDVIQLKQTPNGYNHTLIVTKVNNANIVTNKDVFVTAHTNNCFNKCLMDYPYISYRCLKIV